MLKLGTVTDTNDPDNLRRIKVTSIDRGVSVSNWVSRITLFDGDDLPIPAIGSTVLIGELDSDSTEEINIGVLQSATTNKPNLNKSKLSDWFSDFAVGLFSVFDSFKIRSLSANKPTINLSSDGTVLASNTLGSITLQPNGFIRVVNPLGTIEMGASGISLSTSGLVNISSSGLRYNGVQVAIVGGIDSRGDTTIS